MSVHVPAETLADYAGGRLSVDDARTWPAEVHLEACAECRQELARLAPPPVRSMLDDAFTGVLTQATTGPRPVRRRRLRRLSRRWGTWSMMSWAVMTATAIAAAFLLDRAFPLGPSVVLLLSPVTPLAGLAVAWSRHGDPAWETIAGTARAGADLLLRRTVAVLAFVLPLLAVAGWRLGTQPALWLLPSLAFTSATLLLGGLIGVSRAAAVLGGAWVLAIAFPALVAVRLPALMSPDSVPGWIVAAVVLTGLVVLRAGEDHRRLKSWN
ncbi:integral membrane protein [Actinoplanes friuliensis]|uniref:Integral membrane protein n=1 Tax=Actinoplanes friuliensis DSM 7358 TaxID=1246995 RepID=U5VV15_9ACTN|nr:integral membrane protein [Actinoplanes friuliensis]AGZ40843.1 integral membrane protein [Actinoplanes friuliensis DSM 7358]